MLKLVIYILCHFSATSSELVLLGEVGIQR